MRTARRSRERKTGFTLVEMAIVLIIIGLIIGAILKGQDLIHNARAKRLASFIRGAEISQWAYYDRFGRFAGDNNNDGKIEYSVDTEDPNAALTQELDGFSHSITLGENAFYISFGVNGTTNFMAITTHATHPGTLNKRTATYAKSFDVAIDGSVDANSGNFQGAQAIAILNNGIATVATRGRQGPVVWGPATSLGFASVAMIYYFD